MKKPIILITGGPAFDRQFRAESRMLNKTYTSAIVAAGGIPVMDLYQDALEDYVALADGCIFTGTHQFTPDPALDLHPMQVARIHNEHKLMRAFMESGKPARADLCCLCFFSHHSQLYIFPKTTVSAYLTH